MAFDATYLTCIGPASSNDKPNIWLYKSTDTAATVDSASYFPVGYGLKIGDLVYRITVNSVTAPTSVTAAGFHLVVDVSSTVVDVADVLALTLTDTD